MNLKAKFVFSIGLLGLLCLMLPGAVRADTTTVLNFDSIALSPGGCADGTAYLSSFGITFSSSSGATPIICSGAGTTNTAVSGSNWFGAQPTVNNVPFSYTLTFATPLDSLSFSSINTASNITYPTWNATAYDGSTPVGTVGQTVGFGIPAQSFTIDGPDITSLTFSEFSTGQSINQMPIDDLTLVTPDVATPEPSGLLLLGTSLLALVGMGWRRNSQTTGGSILS